MFTSKKALFLDKDFNKISPITNIETLYFEKAENGNNGTYIINRKSVVKNMPVKLDISNISNLSSKNAPSNLDPGAYTPVYISSFSKNNIDSSYFYINASIWDLLKLLDNYYVKKASDDAFNIVDNSINNINSSLLIPNTSFLNLYNYANNNILEPIYNTRLYNYNEVIDSNGNPTSYIINNLSINGKHKDSYAFLVNYKPNTDDNFNMNIQMQAVWIDDASLSFVCLGNAVNSKWDLLYDIYSNKITYLRDEYENEGNFDFRNIYVTGGSGSEQWKVYPRSQYSNSSFSKNELYFDPKNSYVVFYEDGKHICNKIYNSSFITFGGVDCANNTIFNSHGAVLKGNSNKIYNCSNYKPIGKNIDASLSIIGNNNTIINCNNCNIKIKGNNNTLINLKNQNLNLVDNNIIIGDEIGCPTNNSSLYNERLFLNYSSSTAIANDLSTNCTIYGGIENDIAVYSYSYRTTNK